MAYLALALGVPIAIGMLSNIVVGIVEDLSGVKLGGEGGH